MLLRNSNPDAFSAAGCSMSRWLSMSRFCHDRSKGIAIAEIPGVMLGDDHELVAFGHVECFAHRPIKAVADRLPIGFRLPGAKRDVKERYRGSFPFCLWL